MRLLLSLLFLALSVCETFHGVSGDMDHPPKPTDLTCIDRAIKSTDNVGFIGITERRPPVKTMWNDPIDVYKYQVTYSIKGIEGQSGFVLWNEEHSVDKSPEYNKVYILNTFGRINRSFTEKEMSTIRQAVDALNVSLKKSCQLPADFKVTED